MTPRMMAAWLFFAERRHDRERSEKAAIEFLANQGTWESIKEQRAEWEKDG